MKEAGEKSSTLEQSFFQTMRPKAEDYFKILEEWVAGSKPAGIYTALYGLMQDLCGQLYPEYMFPNLFSRLGFICRECGLPSSEIRLIQNLRRKCHSEQSAADVSAVASDIRLMADFVGKVLGTPVPKVLSMVLPKVEAPSAIGKKGFYKCLRVQVKRWDGRFIYAEKDEDASDSSEIRVDYIHGGYDGDLSSVTDILEVGMSLNLLKTKVQPDGVYLPKMIVVQPDYLVDVSSLANSWRDYGHDALNYILMRLPPRNNTDYTLLGQIAGQFLDDLINKGDEPVDYADSVRRAFHSLPLSFSFVSLNAHFKFHEEMYRQFCNLQDLVCRRFEADFHFDLSQSLIEPSFICEALGISGRMDYLQSDFSRLVEQKSGKMDEWRHGHREEHFIQMMLYQEMLEYNIGVSESRSQAYLLYSRYPDGLLPEQVYHTLLRKVLLLRNRIVVQERACAKGGIRKLLENLTPEDVHDGPDCKLWNDYERPELLRLLAPFSPPLPEDKGETAERHRLALEYFYRFYTFICREQVQSKIAVPGNAGRAFADLWNQPAAVRRSTGDLYSDLTIGELKEKDGGRGISMVRLAVAESGDGCLSNFREGDVVLLYRYDGAEPDVRRQFLMRGSLREIKAHSLLVELSHPQRNKSVFEGDGAHFAIEHDMLEAVSNRQYAGLYAFLTGVPERQDLLLNRCCPRTEPEVSLSGDYGSLNELVRKERGAKDFFIVIGPPGSGKTSKAIRSMVEEELRNEGDAVILLAYTNRAVDELCRMLDELSKENPELFSDYLRVGSELATDAHYRSHLAGVRCSALNTAVEVRKLIKTTRVFAGTVTALSSQQEMLQNKHFTVAFIDEASQILEPQLLPLLFARMKTEDGEQRSSIDRFVFVGDQKQLPAVVQQPPSASKVTERNLQDIGLSDCRNSLFERLLALQQKAKRLSMFYLIEKQGRMHPDVYRFVNARFYQNRLKCVPLPHQQRLLGGLYPHHQMQSDKLCDLLATQRMAFIDCQPQEGEENDKVNSAEAALAVNCLKSLEKLYWEEGRAPSPSDVGIIVPYRNQITMIRQEMERQHIESLRDVSIDTVERYQGSQRDVIFFLFTVRYLFQLSFLAANTYEENSDKSHPYYVDRKLNVALTRAREQCILIGNAPLLCHNALYYSLIDYCRSRGSFFDSLELK